MSAFECLCDDEAYAKFVEGMDTKLLPDNISPFDADAPTMALRGVLRIQALSFVTQSLKSVMTTGEMAEEE
jgi:hypothetical protein